MPKLLCVASIPAPNLWCPYPAIKRCDFRRTGK
jgi:hypothetical protein